MANQGVLIEPATAAAGRGRARVLWVWALVALLGAWLVVYAETLSFSWDEGFHLLTAQLILRGKRPYLDFIFPQTPLNAYWNALWMRVFGDTWHTAHAVQAAGLIGAMILMVDYMLRRAPSREWRLAAGTAVALMIGLNTLIMQFGTLGQAYGFALLLIVAAFRLGVAAVERSAWLVSALAGLCAGGAAASTLLSAPVTPILLLWIIVCNRAGQRWTKAAAFIAGVVAAFTPVILLFLKSPQVVIFNIIKYHLFYRQVEWPGAISHDIYVMFMWVNSGEGLCLFLLGAAGLYYVVFRSDWPRDRRREIYLCAWIAAGLAFHISSAHPTFGRYYLLAVPFLGILACIGLWWISSRLYRADRPLLPLLLVGAILVGDTGEVLYDERDNMKWSFVESVAKKVTEVTPATAPLLGDEQIFFLTRRPPPPEMTYGDSHKLQLPQSVMTAVHVASTEQLQKRMEAGMYSTAETCHNDYIVDGGPKVYAQHVEMGDCDVYWDRKPPGQ